MIFFGAFKEKMMKNFSYDDNVPEISQKSKNEHFLRNQSPMPHVHFEGCRCQHG